jgi:predicted TIM-barrel fold metal-dependent hydrolase
MDNRSVLHQLKSRGIRCLKLCSFFQGFCLDATETRHLFDLVRAFNRAEGGRFFVLIDTFYKAGSYFGKPEETITTPSRLGSLVTAYRDIDFVAAHMGGLTAPFREITRYLPPGKNLYLDTSNASHTLSEKEFIALLTMHGPEHILFGTDWPWFGQEDEMERIRRLCDLAGFSAGDQARVFGLNAARLLGVHPHSDEA